MKSKYCESETLITEHAIYVNYSILWPIEYWLLHLILIIIQNLIIIALFSASCFADSAKWENCVRLCNLL